MVTNFFSAAVLFAVLQSNALEFPKLCPSEENLPKICEQLSKIDPKSTLVFADGYEMPACFISSVNSKNADRFRKEEIILSMIFSELFARNPNIEPRDYSEVFRNPEKGKTLYPELSTQFDLLVQLRNEIEKDGGLGNGKEVDANATLSEAKTEIYNLFDRQPNTIWSFLTAKANFKKKVTGAFFPSGKVQARKLSCRPNVNAFYFENGAIGMTDYMAQHPPLARLSALAHEVGHSVDSCESGSLISPSHPVFSKLVDCFQNDIGKFSTSFRDPRGIRRNCDPFKSEIFCDYLGAYAVEQNLKKYPQKLKVNSQDISATNKVVMPAGYDSIFTILDLACDEKADLDERKIDHPKSMKRLKEVFLRNPTIRKSLNCSVDPKAPYCDVERGLVNGEYLKAPDTGTSKNSSGTNNQ